MAWNETFDVDPYHYDRRLYVSRYSSSGEKLDEDGIHAGYGGSLSSSRNPGIAASGNKYWLFYSEYDYYEKVYARTITIDGVLSDQMIAGRATALETVL